MKALRLVVLCTILAVPHLVFAEPELQLVGGYDLKEPRATPNGSIVLGQPNLKLTEPWPNPVDDMNPYTYFLTEVLEYRTKNGGNTANWDVFGWHGGDYNRLWIKSEGSASTEKNSGGADFQLLYGRRISSYFDFQIGLRYEQIWNDRKSDVSRAFGAIGVQGLAPYYFDVEPTLFVSQDGDISARATTTYDIFLGQRLILQPRIEANAAIQDNEDFGVGSGVNNIEAGFRIRYEIKREVGPYVGVSFGRRFGETAEFERKEGDDVQNWSLVTGVRLWF